MYHPKDHSLFDFGLQGNRFTGLVPILLWDAVMLGCSEEWPEESCLNSLKCWQQELLSTLN